MLNIKKFLGLEYYISHLDQFLNEYRRKHPKLTTAQLKEKEKYDKIYKMRDKPTAPVSKSTFWDKF